MFEISLGLTIVLSPFSTLMSIYVCLKTETTAIILLILPTDDKAFLGADISVYAVYSYINV